MSLTDALERKNYRSPERSDSKDLGFAMNGPNFGEIGPILVGPERNINRPKKFGPI